MTFKREGNDETWLRSLQKRRVSELLADDIPESEAHLMKNGKFACMVCSHRPVFDTVNMLAIHRNGKKHVASIEKMSCEHQSPENVSSMIMNSRASDSKLGHHGLLGKKPYDPRVKRRPDQRRPVLDLVMEHTITSSALGSDHSLSGFDEPSQTISEYRKRRRLRNQEKNIEIKPYRKQTEAIMWRQDKITSTQSASKDLLINEVTNLSNPSSYNLVAKSSRHRLTSKKELTVKTHDGKDTLKINVNPDRAKAAMREKYLQAIASGWKKDRDGQWIKDDNVEFDSDEEPPDLP